MTTYLTVTGTSRVSASLAGVVVRVDDHGAGEGFREWKSVLAREEDGG